MRLKQLNIIKHRGQLRPRSLILSAPTERKTRTRIVFTCKTIAMAFSETLEVVSVSLAATIGEPLTSSSAFVVEIPNEISSTRPCLLRQVTGCCQTS